jgi:hypothetical protein
LHTPVSATARVAAAAATNNEKEKGNTMNNCFEMRCPKCAGEDRIDVAATVWVRLTGDGTDADEAHEGGHYWEDESSARCDACGHSGTVREFSPTDAGGDQ